MSRTPKRSPLLALLAAAGIIVAACGGSSQVAARQGFRWYQIDLTYYGLRALSALGLVSDLHGVPQHILEGRRKHSGRARDGVSHARARRRRRGIVGPCGSRPRTSSSGAPSSSSCWWR